MGDFFGRLWELQLNNWQFALDYWYVFLTLLSIGVVFIIIIKD